MKRFLATLVFALAWMPAADAQRHTLGEVNAETPEGQMLQQIGQEQDAAKKLELMEQFVSKHPSHEGTGWVLEQLHIAYATANQNEKTIEAGEKLLAIDPEDTEASLRNLKAAEAMQDVALVKKWSENTAKLASKAAAEPQPKEADEVEGWKKHIEYATQVNTYTEYALYALALKQTDPKQKLDLIETLQQRNPKSEYMPQLTTQQFLAYRQIGDSAKAIALAEQILEKDQSNEDMLLVVADSYLQTKKEPEKLQAYSQKMIELMKAKPKPDGVSDPDWEKRKNLITGLAYYISGKQHFTANKFGPADTQLRAALPLIDESIKPEVLFLLGLANYKMEKIQEAANFNRACAAIKSPFQAQAARNLAAIRSQYRGVK
jgi:tetratricopeptide (TPR) repeat protein